jgi:hypothetical protein
MHEYRWPCRIAAWSGLALAIGLAGHAAELPGRSGDLLVPGGNRHVLHLIRNSGGTVQRVSETLYSTNWSGYAQPNYQTNATYTSASFSWVVPAVTFGKENNKSQTVEASAIWVGIGGFCENAACSIVDQTLLQMGTAQEVNSAGETLYYAWYETLPQAETAFAYVSPGDRIAVALDCLSNCKVGVTQTWEIVMADLTQGWKASGTLNYKSSLLSAEWIVEAPSSSNGTVYPLADFGTVTLSGLLADELNPGLISSEAIYLEDSQGQTASVSVPVAGDEFSACWAAGTAFAACAAP